jgi:DNA-binding NarL/FixJ family response regulator
MNRELRVVVIDDHHLFRAGLIELLRTLPGITVAAEGSTGGQAITLASDLQPDVVLLDVQMPGPPPAATVRRIRDRSPATRVIIVTMHQSPSLIRELIASGASGYLMKNADRAELIAAIQLAAHPDDMVLVSLSRTAFTALSQPSVTRTNLLSAREVQVLRLLAEAKSNHEIAAALCISDGTVKRHLTNLYAKLQATSRMDAVRKGRAALVIEDG